MNYRIDRIELSKLSKRGNTDRIDRRPPWFWHGRARHGPTQHRQDAVWHDTARPGIFMVWHGMARTRFPLTRWATRRRPLSTIKFVLFAGSAPPTTIANDQHSYCLRRGGLPGEDDRKRWNSIEIPTFCGQLPPTTIANDQNSYLLRGAASPAKTT